MYHLMDVCSLKASNSETLPRPRQSTPVPCSLHWQEAFPDV